ncbi:hypothetical protein NDN08_001442 [Rhodosorus marinus]|uniref:Rab proteins geranylgeranyltransferase component n=1 Tax=Rhodosorus marinus TaxID=101924 RepID=A0AAV8UUZ6_9RHOD|nr:hypothetical protein NDN08_001442 [Rhodosorus marinus]
MDAAIDIGDVDVVIVGTGISESILAAAIARTGRQVLHLEKGSTYGDSWTTIDLEELIRTSEIPNGLATENDTWESINSERIKLANRSLQSRIEVVANFGSVDDAIKASVDITPRPLFCNGTMVNLLVKSGGGDYVDFKALNASFLDFGDTPGGIQRVPQSRSEVFQSRLISAPEKRLLMRFVKICTDEDTTTDEQREKQMSSSNFDEYMEAMLLNEKLRTLISNALIFVEDPKSISVQHGRDLLQLYFSSLARYGTGNALLLTNYGGSELSQAFCRISAVNGSIYVLRRAVEEILLEDGAVSGILTTAGDRLNTRHVFASSMFDPGRLGEEDVVWRFVGVLQRAILDGHSRTLVIVPKGVGSRTSTVRVWQVDSSLGVCGDGYFVLYAECVDGSGTEEDIRSALARVLGESYSEKISRGIIFKQRMWTRKEHGSRPSNLEWIHDVPVEIDFTGAIEQAEALFRSNFPDEGWFPEPVNVVPEVSESSEPGDANASYDQRHDASPTEEEPVDDKEVLARSGSPQTT